MLSYSIGYSKFNGRFIVLFDPNNTLAALTLPSLFDKNSTIFPIFHDPRGMFAFIWTISPLDGISFASARGDFRFVCDLSRRFNRSAILSAFMFKWVPLFVFDDRKCDGVSSVSVKKVWSCSIVRHVFPIDFRRAILLIPTNLS